MAVSKHINFQANEIDMERINVLRKHLSENLAGSHISFTAVIKNALSIAVKHIPNKQELNQIVENTKPF